MALNKRKISIPLIEGINTKLDPKQMQIGSLENLENAVFDEPGKIKKRTGYDKIDVLLLDDSKITDAQRISTYKDELVLFNKTNLYSYSESTDRWTNKGTVSNIFPTSKSIVRNTYEQKNIDSSYIAGLDVYAWEDSRGGIRVSIIDNATGNELISDVEITATGIRPRVEYIGNNAFFWYIDGTDLKYRKVNSANPGTIQPEITVISGDIHASNKIHDTVTIENRVYFAFNSTTSTLKLGYLQENGVISSIQEEVTETPSDCISLSTDSSSRVLITWYDGTDVKVVIKSYTLSANIVPVTTLETISSITNCTISSVDSQNYTVLYEQSNANVYNNIIKKNTIDLSATIGTPSEFIRSCGLASKQFSYESKMYVAAIHESELQSSIFILNDEAETVSKISPNISGTVLTSGNLPKISTISDGMFLYASQIKGRTVSEDNTLFSLLGITSSILDFTSDTRFDNALLGQQLHTNGGMIQSYDGKEIVEHGFHLFPENLENESTATIGGELSDGDYQYSAVYSWIDNKGQKHQSAPSIPLSVTLSGGTSTQTQTIKVPTLRITEKSNVVIDLYRTEDSGTIFYKISSTTAPTYNDKTVNSINILDTTSNTDILSRELLYTTGGVLENIVPPSASIIETFNNRIFLAGLEDENKIQYSKIRQESQPVEFNDTLIINVNSKGGEIQALATMGDKLFIFKETAIYYLSGNGPNNLGQQNDFIEPELISNDVGCETQNSVILTPAGLMFKSSKGIYTITPALQLAYIGSPVEDFNNLTINSANLVKRKNQAIFLTNNQALVYDYFVGKWSVFTNHIGISATSLNENYYYIRSNNEVYKSASHFTDAGSYVKLKLETTWISFAGVQNYQRVYRMLLLGDYKSKHELVMKVAYNFIDAYTQDKVIDTSDFTTDTVYGGDSPYGEGTPYGGTGNQYQIRLNMKTQKCQSIKISIEDSQDEDYGEGLQISNILFVVGVKRGEYKTSQSKTYGTN